MPWSLIESANSWSASSSKFCRGWLLFGSISSILTSVSAFFSMTFSTIFSTGTSTTFSTGTSTIFSTILEEWVASFWVDFKSASVFEDVDCNSDFLGAVVSECVVSDVVGEIRASSPRPSPFFFFTAIRFHPLSQLLLLQGIYMLQHRQIGNRTYWLAFRNLVLLQVVHF